MFSGMFFQKKTKIDNNGRIILPSEAKIVRGEDIAIAKMPNYYELFLLRRIQKLVDDLESRYYDVPKKQREEILKDLNYVFAAMVKTARVDAQKRISLPAPYFYPGKELILQGRSSSIAVFDSEDAYQEYMNSIEPSNILK